MATEAEWTYKGNDIERAETLKHVDTVMIKHHSFHRASTQAIAQTIKSTEEVVEEMRSWLRTGITPDKTRMMTDEAWQWHQDFYQATKSFDPKNESLPEDALVDYYYWTSPYLAHVGNMKFLMMHSQVNFADGTHMPSDRLRAQTKKMKNLEALARKRMEIAAREDELFVQQAMDPGAHRGHPLRKDGLYTKYFWRPFIRQPTAPHPIPLESRSTIG